MSWQTIVIGIVFLAIAFEARRILKRIEKRLKSIDEWLNLVEMRLRKL